MSLSALFDDVQAHGGQRLFERYRPQTWDEVVAQDKAIEQIARIGRRCGLAGKAYWIRGKSGTGKTTIARLLAKEIADPMNVHEWDANKLTVGALDTIERRMRLASLTESPGKVWIVNEADGLRKRMLDRLKTLLEEDLPRHIAFIFTTTDEGEEQNLFPDGATSDYNASQLLSRCEEISLSKRGLAKPFARRAQEIAQAEGYDGVSFKRYLRLVKKHRNNLRRALQAIQKGELE